MEKLELEKTTFVRGLINNLEIEKGMHESQILSPTFNIVFDYEIKKLKNNALRSLSFKKWYRYK